MKPRRLLSLLIIAAIALSVPAAAGYSNLPQADVGAAAAILVDAKTGEILYEKNIHDKRLPASITKVMTCLLALEYADGNDCMEKIVTVSASALADMDPEGSTQNLQEGEELLFRDLLYCSMIASANEACNVLGEYVAGTVADFVALMNERAAQIGMKDTKFMNTHGLPDEGHYSTAYDLYLLCLEAMKNETFMDIAHTETYTVPPTNKKPEGRTLNTTNRLISKRVSPEYLYSYARGIKTGHTKDAGYCLASSAEKDGLALISVVLGAEREEEGTIRSFTETKELFEWGFTNFTHKVLLTKTEPIASVPVIEGLNNNEVSLVPQEEISALVPRDVNPDDINREIKIFEPEGTQAPVEKGQVMGTMTLSLEGREFGTVNLVSSTEELRSETERFKNNVLDFLDQSWVKWTVIGVILAIVLYIVITILYNMHRKKKRGSGYSSYKGKSRNRRR